MGGWVSERLESKIFLFFLLQVTVEEAEAYAEDEGMHYVEASAKTGKEGRGEKIEFLSFGFELVFLFRGGS